MSDFGGDASQKDDGGFGGGDDGGGALVEEGAPIWMTTFGDLMSLLLTFFVLLFSMSEIKMEKFMVAAQSFREATGGSAPVPVIDPQGLLDQDATPELAPQAGEATATGPVVTDLGDRSIAEVLAEQYLASIAEQVRAFVRANSLEETLLVTETPSGVRVRIQAAALFRPGSGALEPGAEWIIDFLGELSESIDIPVIITGHADNQPISTATFASNWELSAYRAAGIARRLVVGGFDPTHVHVESYGDAQPVASNETPEGRAQNRRVEFYYDRDDIIEQIRLWRSDLPDQARD